MLKITKMLVSPLMQNARLLHCTETNKSVLVDPGGDSQDIIGQIKAGKSELDAIWLTHSHLDHCGAVSKILKEYKVKLYASSLESVMRANVVAVSEMYGIPRGIFENCPEPDIFIEEGDILNAGLHKFEALFTPGHSPGHFSFYNKENSLVISGDALFQGSIGRSDLPGGNFEVLISSIREKLFSLPPDTKVLCGHGDDTVIAEEMRSNPFLQ